MRPPVTLRGPYLDYPVSLVCTACWKFRGRFYEDRPRSENYGKKSLASYRKHGMIVTA